MRFEFWKENDKSYLKAVIESDKEKFGYRAEGPYPKIELINNIIEFDYAPKSIHPDILGLICMVCFYPYCKDKVTFPQPVSKYFRKAFSNQVLMLHEVLNGKYTPTNAIEIQNVDESINKYIGNKFAVSYGGGFDSTALYALFPEAIFIHEQIRLPNGILQKDDAIRTIEHINNNGGQAYSFANTNRRGISKPSGWAAWTACTANTLLMSTDLGISHIFTGTVLGALFLSNGVKYLSNFEPARTNKWIKAFNEVGIPIVQVTGGVSEIGNAKILMKKNLLHLPVWCNLDNGNNCHKCWKCFRRDTILHEIGFSKYPNNYWERYKNDSILKELYNKPLYMGHIFKYSLQNLQHIDWIKGVTDFLPENSWVDKFFESSLSIIPQELKQLVKNRILKFLPTIKDEKELTSWNQEEFF